VKTIIRLDDLPRLIGSEIGVSDWLDIDQTMINGFADAIRDHQWIHVDVARATRENGGTIAHGFLSLSLLSRLSDDQLEWQGFSRRLNYGFDRIRFPTTVYCNARVRLHERLFAVVKKGESWLITRDCDLEIEGIGKPAVSARWLVVGVP
jgi:acyl dehydratase